MNTDNPNDTRCFLCYLGLLFIGIFTMPTWFPKLFLWVHSWAA